MNDKTNRKLFPKLFLGLWKWWLSVVDPLGPRPTPPQPWDVFILVLDAMAADNGHRFPATVGDFIRIHTALESMIDAGYFRDSPDDIDGSYWMMAAGECAEAERFFRKTPASFKVVSQAFDDIFNGVER